MSRVSIRYAKALFMTAVEQNKLDEVESDIQLVQNIISENQQFKNMLYNPLIQTKTKIKVVHQLFDKSVNDIVRNFLILVFEKRRSDELQDIIAKFKAMVLDYKGIVSTEIMSAVKLSDEQKAHIRKHVSNITDKEVVLKETADDTLLGGFVVKIKDTVLDFSVKNQLNNLREKMIYG